MKKLYIIYVFISIILFSACDKIGIDQIDMPHDSSIIDQSCYLQSFAKIMSKAIYNEPELREFIKQEALQRRDLDFDVFYPWVKDTEIRDGLTLEEIIKEYDSDNELEMIVMSCPLLTILVPDWSWVSDECFSPKSWKTDSPDVGVSYSSTSDLHEIYHNGKYVFSMQDGEYSDAPILIVKNNERIAYNGTTKSGDGIYEFDANEFIDIHPDSETKTTHRYETIEFDYETATNQIATVNLYGRVRGAYSATNGSNVPQRDYIYYGMTPSVTQGTINKNYYERLYAFKISSSAKGVFDDPVGETSTGTDFKGKYIGFVGRKQYMTDEQILATIWGEGSIEMMIKIYAGGMPLVKKISVPFDTAFEVKQIELKTSINWLGAVQARTYYLKIPEDLDASDVVEPKWIYTNYDLFYWDLTMYPSEYYVNFYECDEATSTVKTFEHTYTYMNNFTSSGEASAEMIKVGWSSGSSATTSKSVKYSESYTQKDDEFGNFVVQYSDKVVLSLTNTVATIKTYHTGYVDAMIIPRYE